MMLGSRCGSWRLLPLALLIAFATVPAEGRRGLDIRPKTWDARLSETEAHLLAGRSREAFAVVEKLVDEMAQGLGAGEGATRAMGTAVGYLALAEAGLGDEADALWHWPLALSLRRDLADWDLGLFGAAGELLERRRDEWQPPSPADAAAMLEQVDDLAKKKIYQLNDDGVVPPKKLRAPAPQATAALRAMAHTGELVIASFIIGRDGSIRMPRILKHEYPGYAFVIVETVRRWRFKPGRYQGEPVDVYYNLTIKWHDD